MHSDTDSNNPIGEARRRARLTQVQLALRSGLSISTIRNAERGLLTPRTVRRVARALDISVEALTDRKATP